MSLTKGAGGRKKIKNIRESIKRDKIRKNLNKKCKKRRKLYKLRRKSRAGNLRGFSCSSIMQGME